MGMCDVSSVREPNEAEIRSYPSYPSAGIHPRAAVFCGASLAPAKCHWFFSWPLILAGGRLVDPVTGPGVGLTGGRFAGLRIGAVRAGRASEVVIGVLVPIAAACAKAKVMRHNRIRRGAGVVGRSRQGIGGRPHLRRAVRVHIGDGGLHQAGGIDCQVNLLGLAGTSPLARGVSLRIAGVRRGREGLPDLVGLRARDRHRHREAQAAGLHRRTIPPCAGQPEPMPAVLLPWPLFWAKMLVEPPTS
jgi:hypothetical protein